MHIPPKDKHLVNPLKRPEVVLHSIMASIPVEVEGRPQKMAASISSAGEPDQKKNQRKNRKKIRLKLYLKRSLNRPGPD